MNLQIIVYGGRVKAQRSLDRGLDYPPTSLKNIYRTHEYDILLNASYKCIIYPILLPYVSK